MAENASAHADRHGSHGPAYYKKTYIILLVLLFVSVMGPLLGVQVITLITAFGIALVKAYLVAARFMHLNIERKYIIYLLVTGIVLILLLFAGVAPDVMNHEGQNWRNTAAQAAVAAGMGEEGDGDHGAAAAEWDAATAYSTMCAACHGTSGAGDGVAGAALASAGTPPANFTDPAFWEERDRETIKTAIRDGGPAVGRAAAMAPFGAQLDAEQLDALTDYVMELRPQ